MSRVSVGVGGIFDMCGLSVLSNLMLACCIFKGLLPSVAVWLILVQTTRWSPNLSVNGDAPDLLTLIVGDVKIELMGPLLWFLLCVDGRWVG